MALKLYLEEGYDTTLAPIRATRYRDWWEDNIATKNHARHCLPLAMANSLGYYILSPGTFIVKWDGDVHKRAVIEHIEKSSHYVVDDHAAFGSFTVQPKFIPRTEKSGEFVYIKAIPNERCIPYTCMEAVIEAWWNPSNFGLVYILNQPGEFLIQKGQPIAQMFVINNVSEYNDIEYISGYPEEYKQWAQKRHDKTYTKHLDYLKGLQPDGSKIPDHVTNWRGKNANGS